MKTVIVTLVSGVFVSLLTSSGIKKDIELFNQEAQQNEIFDDSENFEFQEDEYSNEISFEDVFGKLEENNILEIEDIKVYELEEELDLGFDVNDYLPSNFNPYKGMDSIEELEVEAKKVFAELFADIQQEILNVEDINVYEIEEEVNLDFDTKDYLPSDFNPYQGMNSKEELEVEARMAFTAVFGKTETAKKIIKIEDIFLFEMEETI